MLVRSLLLVLVLSACSGEGEKPAEPPKTGEPPVTEAAAPPAKLQVAELQAAAQNITLVPSPAEMQKALDKAGIAQGLSALVPERKLKMDVENKDVIAVRTGVVLADALLTVKDAPKEKLTERMTMVKAGLTALGSGADMGATIDDIVNRINNDAVSRDDLVKELDELHGAIIPEIEYEAGEKVVPLIQAGSWLEGSNLVSNAIITANKPEAASSLLRQPQVVDYFVKYVQVEGGGKAPDEVIAQLNTTLAKLKEIASKPELTLDDAKEVKSQTDTVLGLL
ncbi:MAG: hypothetical protein ACOZNI_37075 [Myxococcota bacterium]